MDLRVAGRNNTARFCNFADYCRGMEEGVAFAGIATVIQVKGISGHDRRTRNE
jgi:hypothetical protein